MDVILCLSSLSYHNYTKYIIHFNTKEPFTDEMVNQIQQYSSYPPAMICPNAYDVVDVVGRRLTTPRLNVFLDALQLTADKVPHLHDAIFCGSSKDFVIKTWISKRININWKQSRFFCNGVKRGKRWNRYKGIMTLRSSLVSSYMPSGVWNCREMSQKTFPRYVNLPLLFSLEDSIDF